MQEVSWSEAGAFAWTIRKVFRAGFDAFPRFGQNLIWFRRFCP